MPSTIVSGKNVVSSTCKCRMSSKALIMAETAVAIVTGEELSGLMLGHNPSNDPPIIKISSIGQVAPCKMG